jgi:rubrerythrin
MNMERKDENVDHVKRPPQWDPTVWVCLECGEHHPSLDGCPERCSACGRENFWALRQR